MIDSQFIPTNPEEVVTQAEPQAGRQTDPQADRELLTLLVQRADDATVQALLQQFGIDQAPGLAPGTRPAAPAVDVTTVEQTGKDIKLSILMALALFMVGTYLVIVGVQGWGLGAIAVSAVWGVVNVFSRWWHHA